MKKGEEKSLSVDSLEHEKNTAERTKIGIVEIVIVLLVSVTSESIEWAGDAANIIPVVGQAIWLFTYGGGLIVSAGLFLWSFIRGMYNDKKKALKLALMIGGPAADLLTAGIFPETTTLVAAIIIHNYFEGKDIQRITKVLSGHL